VIVTFQGASDDLVEIDGAPGADEFNVYDQHGYAGTWQIKSAGDLDPKINLYVDAYYRGTWSFAARMVEEGAAFPEDLMILTTTNDTIDDYTTMMWIDTKDVDVKIEKVEGKE